MIALIVFLFKELHLGDGQSDSLDHPLLVDDDGRLIARGNQTAIPPN